MIERRVAQGARMIRSKGDGHIEGHAAVFDQKFVLWDSASYSVVEIVKPGTFTRALRENHDVRCLFNHDPGKLLGRTASGTMELRQDEVGLYFDCQPPDTEVGRDVVALVKRGDISGASFSFTVTKETIREKKLNGKDVRIREIEDVDLFDAGPVTYPAYIGTDVSARALELRGTMFPDGAPATVLNLAPQLFRGFDAAQFRNRPLPRDEGQGQSAELERIDRRLRDLGLADVHPADRRLRDAGLRPLF
jgi:HK97 family phage prohead protease